MTLLHLFNMRVEPPKPGVGRVHRMSDDVPQKPKNEMPKYAADVQRQKQILRTEMDRDAVLNATAAGTETRADLAELCGVSKTTIDLRCIELKIKGLIRGRIVKGVKRYVVTGNGLIEAERMRRAAEGLS